MKKPLNNRASVTLALGLETIRKGASLKVVDLATKADCSPQHIARIEDRDTNPSQALIAKLAAALGRVPADFYMSGELKLEEQTLLAARQRRDLAQRERDLQCILELMRELEPKHLETLVAAAIKLSN